MPAKQQKTKQPQKISKTNKLNKTRVRTSGGLMPTKKFNWKKASILVVALAAIGAYVIYRSFASGFVQCQPGHSGGGTYMFMNCRGANKEPVVRDACVVQYMINPGNMDSLGVPYESYVQQNANEIAALTGVPWQYLGKTTYTDNPRSSRVLPLDKEYLVVVDFSAPTNPELVRRRPNTNAWDHERYTYRDGQQIQSGAVVNIYMDYWINNSSASFADNRDRLSPLIGHELGHTVGLADIYAGGNKLGVVDYTQKMANDRLTWGAGDKAGLWKAGAVGRDLSKCWMPPGAGRISASEARRLVDGTYAAILGRKADQSGRNYWENSLMLGRVDRTELTGKFLPTSEAKRTFSPNFSAMTDTQKVTKVFQNVICKSPSQKSLDYWVANMRQYGFNHMAIGVASTPDGLKSIRNARLEQKLCR